MAALSSASGWKHDVFLSFRGPDTRNTFTVHLYDALDAKGINTFVDDQLERGEDISDSLVKVIEGSRISIVVFSADYAGSSSCLEELVKILECRKLRGQLVLPVFYNVNPSDVEKQTGCYADSLTELEAQSKVNSEKMREWRSALTQASTLSGWHLDNGNEAKFIQRIVQKVFTELNRTPLHVAEYPVGLESHIDKMNNMLSIGTNNVQMVGIYGTGGIGKTTIAKAVFNRIANQFEGSCFLANVRETSKEKGLLKLQKTLLLETLGCKRIKLGNCDRGMNVIKNRLFGRRVLIVIDDVDDLQQLKKLAGALDWFGLGSRIIITTRNEQLLNVHGVNKRHNVKELCRTAALELFSWHAFKKRQPTDGYLDLSLSVIKYAQSLPLALVVLGSFLCGRSEPEWKSQLQKLHTNPNKEICDILRISYDGLENLQKTIFLHIACFFKGQDKEYVTRILDACDLNPTIEVKVLAEKSLIRIENNKFEMHDLVQAMGRQVVSEESLNIAERSRLWSQDDVLRVLTEDMGPFKTEALVVDLPDSEEVSAEAFARMSWLKILIVYNANINGGPKSLPSDLRWLEWSGCPLESMPSRFQARKLVALNMQKGRVKQLDFGFKNYVNLRDLNLRDSHFLTETPDFSSVMNLERLILDGCTKLVKVHRSVGYLEKLEILGLEFCSELRTLPSEFKLRSLHTLLLTGCKKLEMFPEIVEEMKFLEKVCLNGTAIKFLPSSIKKITGLKVLSLTYCKNLNTLPLSIYKLKHLKRMLLEGCLKLEKFPMFAGKKVLPSSPVHASNSRNSSDIFPSIGFPTLKILDLKNCDLSDVDFLSAPNWFVVLRDLDLSGNNFVKLPERIKHLANLRSLKLSKCTKLQEIPELPLNIKRVEARNCTSLERYSQLPRVFEFNRKEKSTRLNDIDLSNCCKLAENQVEILEHCLRSKGYRGNSRIEMFLPGNQIPQWFSYKWEHTSSFSFKVASQACEKLAALALCAIVNLEKGMTANISREVFINGQSVLSFSREFFSMETHHVWLYYLPCRFTKSLTPEKNDSIHFEVSFRVLGSPVGSPLKECGVYLVHRQYEDADDPSGGISMSRQLTSISLDLKRSWENNVLELNCYPRAKRKKTTEDSLVAANNSAEHQTAQLLAHHSVEHQTAPLLTNHSAQHRIAPAAEHQTAPLLTNHSAEHQIAPLVAATNSVPEHVVEENQVIQWLSLDLKPVDQITLNPLHVEKLEDRIRLLSESTTSQQVHSRRNGYK